jgi:phosphate transport system permease protein
VHRNDVIVSAAAIVSSFAFVWVSYYRLTPFAGIQGFLLFWFAAFLFIHFLAVAELEDVNAAKDRTISAAITVVALTLIFILGIIVAYVIYRGYKTLTPTFFKDTMQFNGPLSKATDGGGLHSLVGTIEQVGIATGISVPLGVLTAVFLNEVGGRLRRPVRIFVDAMSGVPSIVAGLFIYAVWVSRFGFSGFAGSLALSILMLPSVTRTTEVVLRLVPGGLREASLSLGAPEWKTVWGVVLPTARTGIITASILGVARVIGETAPLRLTSFGADSLNVNPFKGAQDALPLYVYKWVRFPGTANIDRAWTGAFVLMMLVLVLFTTARALGRRIGPRA